MSYSISKSWRKPVERRPRFGVQLEFEPTTKFFDQLSFVGDAAVCCFLLETTEGLILIDAMNPEQRCLDAIVKGIKDIGYELSDLKMIIITHGHGDHYGLADELRKLSGAKILISKGDHELAQHPALKKFSPMDYPVDVYLEDGMDITLGDTTIHCVETPGHTDHCMSFIFPVTDEGRPHIASLWGGTGLNNGVNIFTYLKSVDKFELACSEYGVDVEISNHPPVDNGIERLNVIRNIANGVPNPFVIGQGNMHYYFNKFRTMCNEALKKWPDGISRAPRPDEKKD